MLCVQMYWMLGHHPLAEPREAALRVLPAVDERRVAPPGRSNTADDAV